jgi:hypothetical protein
MMELANKVPLFWLLYVQHRIRDCQIREPDCSRIKNEWVDIESPGRRLTILQLMYSHFRVFPACPFVRAAKFKFTKKLG